MLFPSFSESFPHSGPPNVHTPGIVEYPYTVAIAFCPMHNLVMSVYRHWRSSANHASNNNRRRRHQPVTMDTTAAAAAATVVVAIFARKLFDVTLPRICQYSLLSVTVRVREYFNNKSSCC